MKNKKTIVVALSGGVDSAVSAAILCDLGYKVIGAFMKNWSGDTGKSPCWTEDLKDARRVGAHLGIPVVVFDFEKEYRSQVVEYLYNEYAKGKTPNPDIICNRVIKFDLFLKESKKIGADMIATGHYARVCIVGDQYQLLKGIDKNKDQSYFLHQLNQNQLSSILFPVGNMTKRQVREKAKELGLSVWDKRSTRGICFVGKVALPDFLRQRIEDKVGLIVDVNGRSIGEHNGMHHYTIGQRRGFGVGGGKPYYVTGKDPLTNTVVVTDDEEDAALYSNGVRVSNMHWIGEEPNLPLSAKVHVRYQHEGVRATISKKDKGYFVLFDSPLRAVPSGQFLVIYDEDVCLGGGEIE